MKESFGYLPTGEECFLYTISCGGMTACVTDFGGCLVKLLVPDCQGNLADVWAMTAAKGICTAAGFSARLLAAAPTGSRVPALFWAVKHIP